MDGQNLFRLNLTGKEVESALYAGLNAKEEVDKLQPTVAQNTSDINKNKFDILTKQDTLQPGVNIKNINGQEITGSGEIIIDTSSKVIPSSEVQPDAQELKNLEIDGINWTPVDITARENINTLANTKIDENKANELINNKISSVLTYKGTLDSKSVFPMENNKIGDVYNAKDTGMNSAWDGEKWDDLGSTIDLSGYAKTADIQESLNKADNSLQNIDGIITKNLLEESIQKQLETNIPILSLNFIPVTNNDNLLKNEYTISLEDWEKINNDQVCLLKFNFKHPQSQDNLINTFYFLKSYITSNDSIPTTDPNKKLTKIISFISGSGAMSAGIDLTSFIVLSISNDLHCYLYSINLPQNKKDIGLELVDNTSDLNKPISTATQTALNKKQDILTAGSITRKLLATDAIGTKYLYSGGFKDNNTSKSTLKYSTTFSKYAFIVLVGFHDGYKNPKPEEGNWENNFTAIISTSTLNTANYQNLKLSFFKNGGDAAAWDALMHVYIENDDIKWLISDYSENRDTYIAKIIGVGYLGNENEGLADKNPADGPIQK